MKELTPQVEALLKSLFAKDPLTGLVHLRMVFTDNTDGSIDVVNAAGTQGSRDLESLLRSAIVIDDTGQPAINLMGVNFGKTLSARDAEKRNSNTRGTITAFEQTDTEKTVTVTVIGFVVDTANNPTAQLQFNIGGDWTSIGDPVEINANCSTELVFADTEHDDYVGSARVIFDTFSVANNISNTFPIPDVNANTTGIITAFAEDGGTHAKTATVTISGFVAVNSNGVTAGLQLKVAGVWEDVGTPQAVTANGSDDFVYTDASHDSFTGQARIVFNIGITSAEFAVV